MNVTCNDTDAEFKPVANSLNAFARLREPSCKKELQSLLGMVNTFRSWDVKIAPNTAHLRTLLQKGAVWKWDIYHQREFDSLKEMVSSLTFLEAFDVNLMTNLLVDSSKEGIG